jgi:hypothetical protein
MGIAYSTYGERIAYKYLIERGQQKDLGEGGKSNIKMDVK